VFWVVAVAGLCDVEVRGRWIGEGRGGRDGQNIARLQVKVKR
jgi:hypothetical protein